MSDTSATVLLIEDNPEDARLIREMLAEGGDARFKLVCAEQLSTGLERLADNDIGLVLLDLGLPDSQGFDTFAKAYAQAPRVPIVVLSGLTDEQLAIKTVQEGAQDYLVKGHLDSHALVRTICYAIERKQAEEKLRSQALIFENIHDGIIVADLEGNIIRWNPAAERIFGYYQDEVFQKALGILSTRLIKGKLRDGRWIGEMNFTRKDETEGICETTIIPLRDGQNNITAVFGVSRDITERKEAETALIREKNFSDAVMNSSPGLLFVFDDKGNIIQWNRNAEKVTGYSAKEISKMNVLDFVAKEDQKPAAEAMQEVFDKGRSSLEINVLSKPGKKTPFYLTGLRTKFENTTCVVCTGIDVTERKQAEEALRESETRFRTLFEAIPDTVLVHDHEGTILHINEIGAQQLEWSAKNLVGRNLREIVTPENRASIADHIRETLKVGWCRFETTYMSRSEWQIVVEVNAHPIKLGKKKAILRVARDITERKQAEDALKNSEEKYRNILENIEDGYYEVELNGNFTFFNASMCRILGYPQEEMMGMNNRQFTDKDNAKKLFKTFNEVYRTGEPTKEFDWQIIRKDGTKRYIEVSISLRKDSSGKPIGFRGVARDITERKQAEEELQRSYHKLRESLITTVNTLASTVEMRDPYTAGHQRRATILACAIAEEMGLTEEQFNGLRMAGLIHDIGKISVPAEILNKPGSLSETEFGIIKTHPQAGYKVLKEIDFPWPVAQIVLQHHERLDGSGYPQGLRGEEIMLEARILAVADVVEAMASHRPYRSALGIEVALEEIKKNRGIYYDPDVVDVCARLFTEKGFTLNQEI